MLQKKIAIVHEWLTTLGGSEKVTGELLKIFPSADVFSLIDYLPERDRAFLNNNVVKTSSLQKAPLIQKYYRYYLPWMPHAIERINLTGYDLIISNCHAVSKGVLTGATQFHISYIHTPIRYAWEMRDEYLRSSGLTQFVARIVFHYIRKWDRVAATRPNRIIANSKHIACNIQKVYGRESRVIYPPVDTEYFKLQTQKEDFYLTVSRLVPYKRIDLIVDAFQKMPDKKLIIIGDGPESRKLKRRDSPNIQWLGYQPGPMVRDYMQRCRAFVFAAREDFGITPVEAQACGTPVIAYGEGGAKETVIECSAGDPTGILYPTQSIDALRIAILEFENTPRLYRPEACRKNAEKFSSQRFRTEFSEHVNFEWENFNKASSRGAIGT
jgi:glycosyltransferase involved in cell wall biosynthesis